MNKEAKRIIHELEQHYDLLFYTTVMANDNIYRFGRRENRTCRICRRRRPNVTFKNNAHIFPAALGCKRALTYEECDSCNSRFGKKTEPHLIDFIGARRVVSIMPKRKGHPKHNISENNQSFYFEDSLEHKGWIAKNLRLESIDEKNRVLTFTTRRNPYIPIEVYRSLIKIGYHFLPREELPHFIQTATWLSLDNISAIPSANVIETTFQEKRLEGFHIGIFRRKSEKALPYMGMTLTFYNYTYCTYFPFCEKDEHLIGKNILAYNIPNKIHFHNPIMTQTIDLSSTKLVHREDEFYMSYHPEQDEEITRLLKFLVKNNDG
jgi:hypothetical protein